VREHVACWDCEAAKEPSALDARIAADDAKAEAAKPEPVKVLKGQRSLW